MFQTRSQFGMCMTIAAMCAAAGAVAPRAAIAQCSSQKLLADDRESLDFLGGALSAYLDVGNTAPRLMVGVGSDNTAAGTDAGSVYVFGRINNLWGQFTHFYAADAAAGDKFGASVSAADPYAAIGAVGVGDTGAGYIFERFGPDWTQVLKVIPAGSQTGDDTGRSVAITSDNGGWALISSPLRDVDLNANQGFSDPNAGVVTVLRRTAAFTWTVVDTWPARFAVNAGQAADEHFGASVAIKGDVAVCGVPYGESINWPDNHGYIRVYRRSANNTWSSNAWLVSNNASADDHYGAAVATDGTFIAIGAPDDDATAAQLPSLGAKSDSGCVYIQRWQDGDWYIDDQVFAPDASDNARFGSSVAIDGDRLVVGASGAKKVYVFKRLGAGNWVCVSAINDPDDSANGNFGVAVGTAGGQIIAGDWGDDHGGLSAQGAAYAFTAPGEFNGSDTCDAPGLITGHGEYSGCTTNATGTALSPVSTCGNGLNGPGPDVWYSWTPECSGNVIIDTFGSDYDTVLSVHSACPESGDTHTIVCNDDGGGAMGLASLVTFDYTAGETYLIRISGYSRAAGNYTLRVVDWYIPQNDNCANAQSVGNGTVNFTNCRATTQDLPGTACTAAEPVRDVWFRYTADCAGTVTIDTCGSGFDTVLQVYSGSACPTSNAEVLICNDDAANACDATGLTSRVQFSSPGAGAEFVIRIGAFDYQPGNDSMEIGDGVLNITCQTWCPCDWDHNAVKNVPDIFAYLSSWFAQEARADFDGAGGLGVPDIFAFLSCWFGPCP